MRITRRIGSLNAWIPAVALGLPLSLWSGPQALAQCPGDDPFIDNNECAFAVPLPIGTTTGLSVQTGVDDYWTFDVPVAQKFTLDAIYDVNQGEAFLALLADQENCHLFLQLFPEVTPTGRRVEVENLSNLPITVTARIRLGEPAGSCNSYDLVSSLSPATDPCLGTADDPFEDNDSCSTAIVPPASPLSGLLMSKTDRDYFSFPIPSGMRLRVDGVTPGGGLRPEMRFRSEDCKSVLVAQDNIVSLSEGWIELNNFTGQAITAVLEVRPVTFFGIPSPSCIQYDLEWSYLPAFPTSCTGFAADAQEPNDSCQAATPIAGNSIVSGLTVDSFNPDYYRLTIPPGEEWTLDLISLSSALTFEVIDGGDCSTLVDRFTSSTFANGGDYRLTNLGTLPRDVVLNVFYDDFNLTGCTGYTLLSSLAPSTCANAVDDAEEENDTCQTAVVPSADSLAGLYLSSQDPDYYLYTLNPGQVLNVALALSDSEAPVQAKILAADCSSVLTGAAFTSTGEAVLAYSNSSSAVQNVVLELRLPVPELGSSPCTTYSLDTNIETTFEPFCFGDGSGTACPCGNNSTPGHPGGCANALGDGAILSAAGAPSQVADSLNFSLTSAEPSSFALLVSAANRLPQTGSCDGCGILAFDGFRCAGGDFIRHGTRGTDATGVTPMGWGSPDPSVGSLLLTNGWAIGQTRHFFAFYRSDLNAACMSGRNSSNGVSVTVLP